MPTQKYNSRFKVKSVLEALKYPDGVAAYCRSKGVSDVLIYRWQSQMLSNADSLFAKPSRATQAKIKQMEAELQRKDNIIAIVTEEALELKKKLSP